MSAYILKPCAAGCSGLTDPCASAACDFTVPTSIIDGSTSPLADLAAATALLAAQAPTGCFFESRDIGGGGNSRGTFNSSFSSGTLLLESDVSWSSGIFEDEIEARVYLTAAGGLSIAYAMNSTYAFPGPSGWDIWIYADDETTLIDSVGGAPSASGTFNPTIPSDGYYRIVARNLQASFGGGATTSISLSCTGAGMIPCTVRAAYDDGLGGTAYLVCV